MMRYAHVVMDLNGTLVDTFEDLADALNEVLADHGRRPLEVAQVRQWPGEGLRAILKAAFQATGSTPTDIEISEILKDFRTRYEEHLGAKAFLYPGVAQALATLSAGGVRLSILTNKPLAPSLKLLERMGIGNYFEYMVAGDGDVPRKPDPAGLAQLTDLVGSTPEKTLMFGSSRIDLQTARNAGVRCALIDHDHSLAVRGMGADYVLDHMGMLVALVLGHRLSGAFPI